MEAKYNLMVMSGPTYQASHFIITDVSAQTQTVKISNNESCLQVIVPLNAPQNMNFMYSRNELMYSSFLF